MTELEAREEKYLRRVDQSQPLTEEEILLVARAFRAGFHACREMACDELAYIGPYFLASDREIGRFLELRFIAIASLGDLEFERIYGPDEPDTPFRC